MNIRRILIPVTTVIVTIFITLIVFEIGIRIFKPQKYFAVTVNQWDIDVGTKHIPSMNGFVICPEYSIELKINSKGLRDREFNYHKPSGTRRILCLGDSYACGYGVHAEETFAKVLERMLGEKGVSGDRWEVLNAGVGSTGTANQLALFEKEGHRYAPDIVVECFCPANDFWDNVISGLYTLENGELVKHPAPYTGPRRIQKFVNLIPGYTTFFAKSHLLNLIKYRIAALHTNRLVSNASKPSGGRKTGETLYELTIRLTAALDAACRRRNSRLVMMIIPPPEAGELPVWTAGLIAHCGDSGIPCLDLEPGFRAFSERRIQTAFPIDGHWNATGHELAAQTLYDFLVAGSLLERSEAPGTKP
jgi:hypothetical protein